MTEYTVYDKFLRLVILEGVTHTPKGTWTKNPRILSALARLPVFAYTNPAWFSDADTGAAKAVLVGLEARISRYKIHSFEAFDFFHPLLLNVSPISAEPIVGSFYAAGQRNSKKILSGEETPRDIAAPAIALADPYLVTVARKEKSREKIVSPRDPKTPEQEGSALGYEEILSPEHMTESTNEQKVLADLFSMNHAVYRLIQQKWKSMGPKTEYLMNRIISFWKDNPGKTDQGLMVQMAAELGTSPMSITNWRRAGYEAAKKILMHPRIQTVLEKQYLRRGIRAAKVANKFVRQLVHAVNSQKAI